MCDFILSGLCNIHKTQEIHYNVPTILGRQVSDFLMSNNDLWKQTRGQWELTGNVSYAEKHVPPAL